MARQEDLEINEDLKLRLKNNDFDMVVSAGYQMQDHYLITMDEAKKLYEYLSQFFNSKDSAIQESLERLQTLAGTKK